MKKRPVKNLPRNINEMSKETLQATLAKKKECNAKALQIVELLCDGQVDEEVLILNLEFINQSHFTDVVTERAISKLCGYPVCDKKLENVPQQKYHISTRYNKVFDITERKNFCSSVCFKAAMFLKEQLLTSPLWFRDQEVIPKFTLLKSCSSSLGDVVQFVEEEAKVKMSDVKEKQSKVNSAPITSNDVDEETQNVCDKASKPRTDKQTSNLEKNDLYEKCSRENSAACTRNDVQETKGVCGNASKHKTDKQANSLAKNCKEISASGESVKVEKDNESEQYLNSVQTVEKCISKWFTFETMLYLYGEEKMKSLFSDKMKEISEILRHKSIKIGYSEKIDRMIRLFSLLDADSESTMKPLNPLPDYSILKYEGKDLEIKVKAFYCGQLEVQNSSNKCNDKKNEKTETEKEDNEMYLPLVDTHSQNILRRKIVLDRLNRIIPELLRTLTHQSAIETKDLRDLISNFTLSAHNITFKPVEWYLVAVIVIKLLTVKNLRLRTLLSTETARKHLTLFLMSYHLQNDYLDNMIEWLTDSENILEKLKLHSQ